MKRWLLAAVTFFALTFGVSAQSPLPPPTAISVTPFSVTETPTEAFTADNSTLNATVSETPALSETVDPLVTVEPLEMTVTADVLLPTGIAFQILFREPANGLESITMTADQTGWSGQTINVDPSEVTVDESGLGSLNYVWTIEENAPRLFEPLTVTWSMTPRGGASEIIETELIFADSRVSWTVVETRGIPARFAAAAGRATTAVLSAQLSSIAELLEAAGRQIQSIKVVLFPPGVAINPCISSDVIVGLQTGIEAPCMFERATTVYANQGWDVAAVTSTVPASAIAVERVVRAAYPALFDSEDVPEWFKTGLIDYLSGAYNANELDLARSASRNNSFLTSLNVVPSDAEVNQWRLQSLGTVVYMASQIGVAPFLDILGRLNDGEALDEIWEERSGQTMSALNVGWRNWIFSPRAEAAYNSRPSLAPTLTLVPTRTASFTPTPTSTFTPSATWTNTLTPSMTPTLTPSVASGFQQPTAAPTSTPTATLRPTITPRPAVAFSLEDEPEEPPSPLDRSLSIIAATAVIVVVLSGVFLFVSRRRK